MEGKVIPKDEIEDTDDYIYEPVMDDVYNPAASENPLDTRAKTHVCDTCLKTFRTSKELRIHIRVHTNERPYKCDKCDKAFKQPSALRDHMNTHTGIKKHTCKVCGGQFATGSSLRRHDRQIHAKAKTFSCSLCSEVFLNKVSYLSHKEAHYAAIMRTPGGAPLQPDGGDGGYRCTVCGRSYSRRNKLTEHLDVHAEKTEYCEQCGRNFTRTAFKRHQAKRHPTLHCGICGEIQRRRRLHAVHLRRHFSVATDVCDYCGERFPTCDELSEHMRKQQCGHTETEDKRSKKLQTPCQMCNKTYRSANHLQQHQDFAHVKCTKCKKLFRYYDEMQTHFMNHHRAYKCTRCRMVFRSKSHLAFHLNTGHFIITKFTCSKCGSRFSRYKYLRAHLNAHTMIKEAGINALPDFASWIKQVNPETSDVTPKTEAPTEEIALSMRQESAKDDSAKLPENKRIQVMKSPTTEPTTDRMGKHKPHSKNAKKSPVKKKVVETIKNNQNKKKTAGLESISKAKEASDQRRYDTIVDPYREVRCQFCPRIMIRRHLIKHCTSVHGKHACHLCLEVFFSVTELQEHQCQVRIGQLSDCNVCGQSCPTRTRLYQHIKDKHMGLVKNNLRYKCTYCRSYMVRKNALMRHQYMRHFNQLPLLVRHNYAGQMVACTLCKELVNLTLLSKHRKSHGPSEIDIKTEHVDIKVEVEDNS